MYDEEGLIPPDEELNECNFCGQPSVMEFCSKECRDAYFAENYNDD